MRAQVIVFGPVERELHVRLDEDLLPEGTKRAEELTFHTSGGGVDVAERLSQLGLSAAILTGIGSDAEDRGVLSSLRKRGIQTRGTPTGAHRAPLAVALETPRHRLRITSAMPAWAPPKDVISRAIRGSRHFHVCGSAIVDRRGLESVKSGLRRARTAGVSTSLDLVAASPSRDWKPLLRNVDVLFAESAMLRALAEERRLGAAADEVMRFGVATIAVQLGAGGCRIYARDGVTRVPSLGPELSSAPGAFASGVLLGWLLGARAAVVGLFGNAASLRSRHRKPPTRRELSVRLARARTDPQFRKLVSAMQEGERLLQRPRRLPRRELAPPNPSI